MSIVSVTQGEDDEEELHSCGCLTGCEREVWINQPISKPWQFLFTDPFQTERRTTAELSQAFIQSFHDKISQNMLRKVQITVWSFI